MSELSDRFSVGNRRLTYFLSEKELSASELLLLNSRLRGARTQRDLNGATELINRNLHLIGVVVNRGGLGIRQQGLADE